MAITLTSDYSKKLGLPGYSSHQFSVSIQTELTDLERVPGEVARLYQLLQQAVDREIQQTGFVPGDDYGLNEVPSTNRIESSNGNGNGSHPSPVSNGRHGGNLSNGAWNCSPKQSKLIADLTMELGLTDAQLDERSQQLFNLPARQLNKLSASGLITSLLDESGKTKGQSGSGNGPRNGSATSRNGGGQ